MAISSIVLLIVVAVVGIFVLGIFFGSFFTIDRRTPESSSASANSRASRRPA